MTNFATFIDTGNGKAPIARPGKAKQKRSNLRLVGLGLVVTRDGGIPLLSHAYPGGQAGCHPVPGDDEDPGHPASPSGLGGRAAGRREAAVFGAQGRL